MSAENFVATAVKCNKWCFALTFDIPNCVSKVLIGSLVLSFGVPVSSLRFLLKAVDGICATSTAHKDKLSKQRCLISDTFSNSSSDIGEGEIMKNQFGISPSKS